MSIGLPQSEPPATYSDRAERSLRDAVAALRTQSGAPGVAGCVVVDGHVVAAYAEGICDTHSGAPMKATTTFDVASQTKLMTALTVLGLASTGRLRLDDPITRHLRRGLFRDPAAAADVTVLDLLLHRAGFTHATHRNVLRPLHVSGLSTRRRRSASVPVTDDAPFDLEYSPGTSSQYSNVGAAIAAEIAATCSGTDYAAAVDRLVLGPLEMQDTRMSGRALPEGRRHRRGHRWAPLELHPRWNGIAGGVSTTLDLGKLISPYTSRTSTSSEHLPLDLLQQMSSAEILGDAPCGHVVGWRLERQRHGDILHQAGTRPGLSVKAMIDRTAHTGVVLLTNRAYRLGIHGAAEQLLDTLTGRLRTDHEAGPDALPTGAYTISGSPLRNPTFWMDGGGRVEITSSRAGTFATFGHRAGRYEVRRRDGQTGIVRSGSWVPLTYRVTSPGAGDGLMLGGPYTGLWLTRRP